MEVFIVVDLAVDLLLNNLVCMGLDDFVGDSWFEVSIRRMVDLFSGCTKHAVSHCYRI